jgi:hypothetical protein
MLDDRGDGNMAVRPKYLQEDQSLDIIMGIGSET